MKKYLFVDGSFSPISNAQVECLRALHQRYPEKTIILPCPKDAFYEELLLDILAPMPYCWISNDNFAEEHIALPCTEVPLKLENLWQFPVRVSKAIFQKRELIEKLVAPMMSAARFAHVKSVAQTAQELAIHYDIDVWQAYLAGILHDCLKDYSEEENDAWLRYYDPHKLQAPKAIKHGYAAKYFLRHAALFTDKDVLNAIYHHSDGESHAKLAIILYIADKREPLRQIHDDLLQRAFSDLYGSFRLLKEDVKAYIRERKHEKK